MKNTNVMLHHFRDGTHPNGQGALSEQQFVDIIHYVGEHNILPAHEWAERALKDELKPTDVCLTFDDALRCQYDVAYPVLKDLGLTAFWFVYSSVFEGNLETLEIYRYFRSTAFEDIDDFYAMFFQAAQENDPETYLKAMEGFVPEHYLRGYDFYTRNDRIFRYLRDAVLIDGQYDVLMGILMRKKNFDVAAIKEKLWMQDQHLRDLRDTGHVIGLHSYSHPTTLSRLDANHQRDEYTKNQGHLTRVLGEPVTTMSHPCNSYNSDTLAVLNDLGITLGFCANMADIPNRSMLEIPREDHANILKAMKA